MTTFLHKVAGGTRVAPVTPQHTAITKETLVDLVLDVVARADWSHPGSGARPGRNKTERGEVLLATLTYCYAWGLYSSGEIEAAILRNRNNSELLDRYPLDRKSFMQFRRYNRDLITSCLTQVLGALNTWRDEFHESPIHMQDAEQRIERAVVCDSMDCDE
jgi:hypothetical protein